MPVAPARAVTTWSTLRARFYSPSTHTGLQLIVCARAAPRLAEGFMPVAPARAVTARSTLRACCVRPPAPAPASIAGIQQPPKCSSNSGLSIPVKFGSSSLTIPIRDSQHSGKECVLSLGRSPVAVAMAWMGGLALLSARSLAMPMRGLGCP